MTTETQHYGLTKLAAGESLHAGDGRFPSSDRDTIDQVMYANATHHHTGESFSSNAPELALDLSLSSTGGTLPADTTIRYVYTITDPSTGETTASPVASVTTPAAIESPAAPTFSIQSINGTLPPGQYFYVLSAYQGASTIETKALNSVSITVPPGTSTNEITLTLPTLAAGATGYNIYRRAPGDIAYFFVGNQTGLTFVDGGVTATGRSLPTTNSTNATNSVTVSVPGATPSIPAGSTWTIYRSYTTSFTDSHLQNEDEFVLSYVDVGNGTTAGSPPSQALAAGQPDKVLLTAGAEVQGTLPGSMVTVVSTTDPGVMSAADKTKLNGIETAATADMTAAEILTAVKTVDGTGSGLDADLLDGQEASAFATSGHTHAVTYKVARKGADQTINNSATLTNDTALTFTVAASETWVATFYVFLTGDATADWQGLVTAPAGATVVTASHGPATGGVTVEAPAAGTVVHGADASVRLVIVSTSVAVGGTAGSVTLQWAQQTATVADTTVKAGSHLTASKV